MTRPNFHLDQDEIDLNRKRASEWNQRRKKVRYGYITYHLSRDLYRLTKRMLVADIRQRFGVSEKVAIEAYNMGKIQCAC